jgi:hypothetical protein
VQDLRAIKAVMREFDDGTLEPAQFIKRYNALWRRLRDEEYAKLDMHASSESSGTPARQAVSQLFAEIDAYREQPDAPGEAYLTLDQLHQAVRDALRVLDRM